MPSPFHLNPYRIGEPIMADAATRRSAVISDDGKYRYRLDRDLRWEGKTAAFIMVNPSTADAEVDDATIRKLIGFSAHLGFGRFIVGNKFAYRATDVSELKTAADPVGPANDAYLSEIVAEADIVIAAWGPLAKLPRNRRSRWNFVDHLALNHGKPLHCLGVAQDGHPRHPLMLAYATPMSQWQPLT